MDFSILIVDDEEEICASLSEILMHHGYNAHVLMNPEGFFDKLQNNEIDLIIMDVKMPTVSGINLLKQFKEADYTIPTIMISGYASSEEIVTAMRCGALNFYSKPIKLDKILDEIGKIAEVHSLRQTAAVGLKLVTQNGKMKTILSAIETIAPTDASILITGESGTGKELVAASIHEQSARKEKPFIKINCAAIPETLLESELFGYEQGAFTDAKGRKKGKFEIASGGTIFLDEIGDMSLRTQAKLLRFLEEKEFQRLGSTVTIRSDVRVIAATNKQIESLIKEGLFRDDLFYRLAVERIELPPLNERKDDLILLTNFFIQAFNTKYEKNIIGLSEEVSAIFTRHDWPGNIRELKNCIERAVIFCRNSYITPQDLSSQYRHLIGGGNISGTGPEQDTQKVELLEALRTTGGNKSKAAELLNIHRNTLYQRLRKYNLDE